MKQLVKLNKRPSSGGRNFTYVLRYVGEDGKRKWETLGHTDKRKAEKQRSQKEKDLKMGYFEPDSMRLKDFMKDSLKRTGDQIRESTQVEYRQAMKDFINTIGNIDYKKVQQSHGEYYRQTCLDKGQSPATALKKLQSLKRFFSLAVQRNQLDENPLRYVKFPRVPKPKIRTYTSEEVDRILKAADGPQNNSTLNWHPLITLALTTGLRRGELLNLTWSDIDFDKMVIELNSKLNTQETWEWKIKDTDSRFVPLTKDVCQLLIELHNQSPQGYPYILVPQKRYDYIQKTLRPSGSWTLTNARTSVVNNFTRHFQCILKKARVKHGTFHDIRKTAITNWFQQGLSEYDVMTLAGHANFETTHKFYLTVADNLMERARKATTDHYNQNRFSKYHQNDVAEVIA
ncbi:MAG: tyrosine-type recombinase/integrase [Phycisphaerae bacterium]|nr:tyrosine-type recombinase/integrase [Phycisphaerae bacterium]